MGVAAGVAVSVVATEVASGAGAVVEVVVVLEAAVATMKGLPRKLLVLTFSSRHHCSEIYLLARFTFRRSRSGYVGCVGLVLSAYTQGYVACLVAPSLFWVTKEVSLLLLPEIRPVAVVSN